MEYENLEIVQKLCKEIKEKQEFVDSLNGEYVCVRVYNNQCYLDEIPTNLSIPHEYQKIAIAFKCNLIEKVELDIRQLRRKLHTL